MKKRFKVLVAAPFMVVLAGLLAAVPLAGCSRSVGSTFVPYIPPFYYACTETTPDTLYSAYFSHYLDNYFNLARAERQFNNQIFVFKNITLTADELNSATPDYMWLDGKIQCYFLGRGAADQLQADEAVDIVGINSGDSRDTNTLMFTGCLFLPSGAVNLPADGSSQLVVTGGY